MRRTAAGSGRVVESMGEVLTASPCDRRREMAVGEARPGVTASRSPSFQFAKLFKTRRSFQRRRFHYPTLALLRAARRATPSSQERWARFRLS